MLSPFQRLKKPPKKQRRHIILKRHRNPMDPQKHRYIRVPINNLITYQQCLISHKLQFALVVFLKDSIFLKNLVFFFLKMPLFLQRNQEFQNIFQTRQFLLQNHNVLLVLWQLLLHRK